MVQRALTDLLLARADGSAQRFYSLFAEIQKRRKDALPLNDRQRGVLNRLRSARGIPMRDMQRLILLGLFVKEEGGGRSTPYALVKDSKVRID